MFGLKKKLMDKIEDINAEVEWMQFMLEYIKYHQEEVAEYIENHGDEILAKLDEMGISREQALQYLMSLDK